MTKPFVATVAALALSLGTAAARVHSARGPAQEPQAPTSYELIDRALAAAQIDTETAYKYRVFAGFADTRLPAAYHGDDRGMMTLPPSVAEAGRLCERLGMSVNISCKTGESSVACAAALHVACVIPTVAWALTLTHGGLREDVTAHPPPAGPSHVECLDRPGLGVEVDEDRVRRHRIAPPARHVA